MDTQIADTTSGKPAPARSGMMRKLTDWRETMKDAEGQSRHTAEAKTAGPAPGYRANPEHRVEVGPSPRRVRAVFNGETVADSTRMLLVRETRHLPVYYFPLDDVRRDLMRRTDRATHCPYKGTASYWSLAVAGREAEDAMWAYETPYDESASLAGYAAFYWDRIDRWYEEDEEIFVHPRDPYKRVDAIPSSRPVRVVLGGETVAETVRAHFLFETGLPVRHYIPRDDVRMDLLTPTAARSRCPYKGEAVYWSASAGSRTYEDVAWSYPDPVPECPKIAGLVCFYGENVDAVFVDGAEVERPRTKWSRD